MGTLQSMLDAGLPKLVEDGPNVVRGYKVHGHRSETRGFPGSTAGFSMPLTNQEEL